MNDATHPPEDAFQLATLGKAFQLEGGLRIYPLGDAEAAALEDLARRSAEVFVESLGARRMRQLRQHGSQLIVYFEGVRSREAARSLANAGVYVELEALPEPPEGLAYVDALIGVPLLLGDEAIGEVVDVIDAGGQDLLVVSEHREGGASGREWLLPLQAPYLVFDGERVTLVDPPEGLLE